MHGFHMHHSCQSPFQAFIKPSLSSAPHIPHGPPPEHLKAPCIKYFRHSSCFPAPTTGGKENYILSQIESSEGRNRVSYKAVPCKVHTLIIQER